MTTKFVPFDNTKFQFLYGNTTVTGNTSTTTFAQVHDLFNLSCGYSIDVSTVSDDLPNASDPTQPGFTRTKKDVINYKITGSGYVAENHKFWLQEVESNDPQLCRWGQTGANGYSKQASLILTKYDPSFDNMKQAWKVNVEFSLSDGAATADWANAVSNTTYIANVA